jgi:hypothetical protein
LVYYPILSILTLPSALPRHHAKQDRQSKLPDVVGDGRGHDVQILLLTIQKGLQHLRCSPMKIEPVNYYDTHF